jgi:ABC-2 type transport system ATP-binding protein
MDTTVVAPSSVIVTTAQSGHDSVPPAVVFSGIEKRFGATQALAGIDLRIPIGSTVALLGPNGAGKSTSINLMLNLLHPDAGSLRVLGLDPAEAMATGRVGAMLQTGGLPTGVTVGEIVRFARELYSHPMAFDEILRVAGLTALVARRVEGLSGGETQRLRFALAIAGDPDLLFLDEPTVAMDVEGRRAFWADMRAYAAEGRTVLFATHYLDEADQVADRVIVLDKGRVVADGTSGSIKSRVHTKTVRFTLPGANRAALAALPSVTDVAIRGDAVTLRTSDADATTRALYRTDLPIRDLEVSGAALEDAFVALTSSSTPTPETSR